MLFSYQSPTRSSTVAAFCVAALILYLNTTLNNIKIKLNFSDFSVGYICCFGSAKHR